MFLSRQKISEEIFGNSCVKFLSICTYILYVHVLIKLVPKVSILFCWGG